MSSRQPSTSKTTSTSKTNGSTEMNQMYEDLARAHMAVRLGEAHEMRRGHRVAVARRMSRRAERAAAQARLALARAL